MSVIGNRLPPYHAHGLAQACAAIRSQCAKLQILVSEMGGDQAVTKLRALDVIQDAVADIEKFGGKTCT